MKVKLSGEWTHYCPLCESVVGDGVHHCRQCKRCVKDLDHHCKWVNNCVNKANYKLFMRLMASTLLYIVVNLILCIVAVILILSSAGSTLPAQTDNTKRNLFLVPAAVLGTIDVVLIILCTKLYCFHLWLVRNNLTTLSYILSQRESKKPNQILPKDSTASSGRPSFRRELGTPSTERIQLSKDITVPEPKFSEEELKGQTAETHDRKVKVKSRLPNIHNSGEEIRIKKLRRPIEESEANLLRQGPNNDEQSQNTEAKQSRVKRDSDADSKL